MADTSTDELLPRPTGEEHEEQTQKPKKKAPWWKKSLKILGWTIGGFVGLLIILMCLAAWILTPERLTPLVEKYGSQYLNADLKVKRVELTVWSSFPKIKLDVTDLTIISRTLDSQPDSVKNALGENYKNLLSLSSASGSINPWSLFSGTIVLGDIDADGVNLNLVSYNETINNYDIFPPSEPESKNKERTYKLRFGDINIRGGSIRYFDAESGIDVRLASPSLSIRPSNRECSRLETSISGMLSVFMDKEQICNMWPVNLKGPVEWNAETMDVSMNDYSLGIAIFDCRLTAAMNLEDEPLLKSCDFSLLPFKVSTLLKSLPGDMLEEYAMLRDIDTDMTVALNAKVRCPWKFDSPEFPDVNIDFNVPGGNLIFKDSDGKPLLRLNKIALSGSFFYNGKKPELSYLDIPLLELRGDGASLAVNLGIEEMLSENPLIRFGSRGSVDLSVFSDFIPYVGSLLQGSISADASLTARLDDLMNLRYENIDADGSLQVRDFVCELPALATHLYSHIADFYFGNSISADAAHIPGKLLASARVDTLRYNADGMELTLGQASLRADASDKLLTRKAGSKQITPMKMSLSARNFRMISNADTTKVRAGELKMEGSITRYEENSESPLLEASLTASRLRYADPTMRLSMKKMSSSVNAHLRSRKNKRNKKPKRMNYSRNTEHNLTLEVDEGMRDIFKRWGIAGNLSSDNMRVTHIMYPVPVNIRNLNLDFSLDSVRLHRATIVSQANSLSLSGTISNIRHLMLGRVRKPLKLRLNAHIDSLNLNQVAYNFTLGSALQSQRGDLSRLSEEEQDAIVKRAAAIDTVAASDSDSIPLILPRNIDAIFRLRADKALYGDINLYNSRADLILNDGAASIDSLQASTDFGDAYLNLLYSSRNPRLLNMAVDLGLSRINLQNLFATFPTIAEMAPAITDLSGMVGAKLVGSFDMYPNMDIDFNSLNAVLNLTGTNLELTQSPLIRKVARMMLIRKNGPLQISDINIQLSLHDNVLRLYPFKFGMEKYRFALLGQNDLSENMFYHLSVLKSPIPFRFGINVKGSFDKPKIRFGGPKYKEDEAQEMVNLIENQRVNFVHQMRLQLHKLINRAAVAYADRPEFSEYGQEKEMKMQNDSVADDDSMYDSPADMLGAALRTPVLKTLNGNSDKLRDFSRKYNIGDKEPEKSNKKNKKKNKSKK